MVTVPAGDFGDLLVTDGTESVLFIPQVQEPSLAFQPGGHLHVEAIFKIRFPGRVVGIGVCLDFRVPLNADRRGCQ